MSDIARTWCEVDGATSGEAMAAAAWAYVDGMPSTWDMSPLVEEATLALAKLRLTELVAERRAKEAARSPPAVVAARTWMLPEATVRAIRSGQRSASGKVNARALADEVVRLVAVVEAQREQIAKLGEVRDG